MLVVSKHHFNNHRRCGLWIDDKGNLAFPVREQKHKKLRAHIRFTKTGYVYNAIRKDKK